MKTRNFVATLAFFAAGGAAFAQQTEFFDYTMEPPSTRARADVVAELHQAKADGSYALAHQEFQGQYPALSAQAENAVDTKSRAQVISELERAKADGSYSVALQVFPGQFPSEEARYAQSHQRATALAGSPQDGNTR